MPPVPVQVVESRLHCADIQKVEKKYLHHSLQVICVCEYAASFTSV